MNSDFTRLNNPLYLALREIYQLPVVEHGYFLKSKHPEMENEILYASYRGEGWDRRCPKDIQCRLREKVAYVQYGDKTLKIDLVTPDEIRKRKRRVVEVPAEEFPPCRRRENKEPDEYSIFGHDVTGTEEWTWKWAERKLTKEERKAQLADYIGNLIPEVWGLETYRLCEISNIDRTDVKRYLTVNYMHNRGAHLLCGDFVSQDAESNMRLLSSGQGPQNENYFGGKILGFYSGDFLNSYALCYTPEGFNIVHFAMSKVDVQE